jgi:hypothetical protein
MYTFLWIYTYTCMCGYVKLHIIFVVYSKSTYTPYDVCMYGSRTILVEHFTNFSQSLPEIERICSYSN